MRTTNKELNPRIKTKFCFLNFGYLKSTIIISIFLLSLFLLLNFSFADSNNPNQTDKISSISYYQFPIYGIVFEDQNSNGKRDENESGLSKIPVSDGRTIAFTNKDGSFSFDNSDKKAKYVFACIPNGFEKRPNFYHLLLNEEKEISIEIPLEKSAVRDEKAFSFVQISDVHINGPDDITILKNSLDEIVESESKPAFIIATGDLVNKGDYEHQLKTYQQGVLESKIPVFSVAGNHDRCEGDDRAIAFNKYFGPDYYSFNHGAFHFLILSNTIDNPYEEEWIKEDLEKLAKGKKVLVFQHYPPYEKASEKFANWGIDAVFSGHWHSSKITNYKNIYCLNLPTFLWGGIDLSPSGFRIVNVKGRHFTTEFRPNGVNNFVNVISPAKGSTVIAEKPLWIWVDVFDTKKPIKKITATIENANLEKYPKSEIPLIQQSPLSWRSKKPLQYLWPGEYKITLKTEPALEPSPEPILFKIKSYFYDPKYVPKIEGEWAMFMGGSTHSGLAKDTIKLPLELEWVTSSGGYIDFSSPIIAEGKIFIGIKDRDEMKTNGVMALDAKTGEQLWFAKTDSAINHSPVYYKGKVIAQEMGGRVHAFNSKDGKEIWFYDCGNNYFRWLYGSPAIEDGKVFVGSSKWFASLDAETGKELWKNTDGVDWISSYCSPAVSAGKVLNGGNWLSINKKEHGVYAMDINSGKILWGCDVSGVHCGPTIQDNKVYFNDIQGNFCIAALESGEILWRYEMLSKGNNWSSVTPAIKGNIVITGSSDGTVYAMDIEKREKIWEFKSGKSLFRCSAYNRDDRALLSSPTISGELVFIGSGDGNIYALDINTGQKRWEYTIGVPVLSTPTILGRWLFVGAYDGNVYAFCRRDY